MKFLNKLAIVLFVFSTVNCSLATNKVVEKKLIPDIIVSQLRDSSYLSKVKQLVYRNNKLYMAEYIRNQVIVFDKDLNSMATIGRQGRGPTEIVDIGMLFVDNDTVYVNDGGGNRIQSYDDSGKHIKSISYAEISTDIDNNYGYTYIDNTLTIVSEGDDALVEYDFVDGAPLLKNSFGKRHEYSSHTSNIIMNSRFVDIIDNKIVAMCVLKPFVDLYDLNGKLLQNYNIGEVPLVKDELEFDEQESLPSYAFNMLLSSYCIYGNDLYLMLYTSIPVSNTNTVIKFSLDGDEFKYSGLYKLPSRVYQGIAVSDKYLYSFDLDKSSICRFKL